MNPIAGPCRNVQSRRCNIGAVAAVAAACRAHLSDRIGVNSVGRHESRRLSPGMLPRTFEDTFIFYLVWGHGAFVTFMISLRRV